MSQSGTGTTGGGPTAPQTARWRASKVNGRWTVTSPTGNTYEPFVSQRVAFTLAWSMASITPMLAANVPPPARQLRGQALPVSPKHRPNRRTPLQVIR